MIWPVRIAWLCAGATLALYLLMGLWSLPHLASLADGAMPFDLRPAGYSAEQARDFLAAIGPAGRTFYLEVQHVLDRVFPALLAVTLVLVYALHMRRGWAVGFGLLAVAAALVDWQENAVVSTLLRQEPPLLDAAQVRAAARLTMLKSALSTLTLSAFLFVLGRSLWRTWRGGPPDQLAPQRHGR